METAQKKKSFKNEIKGIQQTSLNISTSVADNVRFSLRGEYDNRRREDECRKTQII